MNRNMYKNTVVIKFMVHVPRVSRTVYASNKSSRNFCKIRSLYIFLYFLQKSCKHAFWFYFFRWWFRWSEIFISPELWVYWLLFRGQWTWFRRLRSIDLIWKIRENSSAHAREVQSFAMINWKSRFNTIWFTASFQVFE